MTKPTPGDIVGTAWIAKSTTVWESGKQSTEYLVQWVYDRDARYNKPRRFRSEERARQWCAARGLRFGGSLGELGPYWKSCGIISKCAASLLRLLRLRT
jgi:hypothetical protein